MRTAEPSRIFQIESLRAVAIAIVVVNHALVGRNFPLGGFGISLFYVLSGYFATRGLLNLRWRFASGEVGLWEASRVFLTRRWLRLLPLYYIVIAVALLLHLPLASEFLPWNLTLTTNIGMLTTGQWAGFFSPFWSLAALEQILLFWPLLILSAPRRYLRELIFAIVLAGIAYRVFCAIHGLPYFWWFLPPIACLDQVGIGALLAVLRSDSLRGRNTIGAVSGGLFALIVAAKAAAIQLPFAPVYAPTVASIFFAWAIHNAHEPYPGWLGSLMQSRLMIAAGRASYSVFLTHGFVIYAFPLPANASWQQMISYAGGSVVAAYMLGWIVYWIVEYPLVSLVSKSGHREWLPRKEPVGKPSALP